MRDYEMSDAMYVIMTAESRSNVITATWKKLVAAN
jgi:hypothetical protein